jgi:Mrp family chromosome partitioning ATPase
MPHVEKALEQIRRKALHEKSQSGKTAAVPHMPDSRLSETQLNHIEAVPRPELLKDACAVTLDPLTLNVNRIRGFESSAVGESAYKILRTRILQRMRSNGWHTLAVTSPRANAGKTLTSVNLAISLAREPNQEVILVDLDLRNPGVGPCLGLSPTVGIEHHLKDDVPIEQVLLKPNIPRLYVMPSAERLEHSSELLASWQMATLIQTLVSTSPSTIVIFDMPPLLEADDMLTLMPLVDAVLFVVAQSQTRRLDLEKSSELFKDLNLLGTVLNKSNDEAPSAYY